MHFRSQRGMRQPNFRKSAFILCIGVCVGLILMPMTASALARLLTVEVDTVWTDEAVTVRGVSSSFPYYVLSRVKVYDENNHYVPRLAARDRWLGLFDMTEGNQYVSEVWRTTHEYHVENNSIPENPNVKSNPEYFGVTEVRMYDYDLSMMLVMDYSRSIDDIQVIEDASLDLVQEIDGRDPIGVVKFSDEVKVCQTLTRDVELLEASITDSTVNRVGTSLYCSIDTAINHLQYQPGRRVVIVYTDGKNDFNSFNQTTLEEVTEHAQQKNVELFVIGLGGGIDEEVLLKLAKDTGGKYFFGEASKRLEPIFLKIYGDLRGYYIMRHLSPDPFHNGTWRWVEVELVDVWKGGTGRGKYFVPYYPTDVRVSKTVTTDSMIFHPGGQTAYAMASDTVTFSIQVQNRGQGTYGEIQIEDVLDDSLMALSNGMVFGENVTLENLTAHQIRWSVPRLDAGSSVQIAYKAKLDAIMPMGSMALTNHVQLYGDSAFTVESDQAIVQGYGQPDFTIDCITPGVIASPTQKVMIQAQILNQGNAHMDTDSFRVSFEHDGQILDYDTLSVLELNEPTIVSGFVSFPELGDYEILVRADVDQSIQELDETNNTDVCTLNVHITDLGVQISDVNYRDTFRGVRARFPADLITFVNVWDQNVYPVHGLANASDWSTLEDNTPVNETAGDIWLALHETYRDIPNYPPDSDVRPGLRIGESVNGSASWTVMVTTGSVPAGWLSMVRPALTAMANRMQSGDRVCLMEGHGSSAVVQSYTNNSSSVKNGIEHLSVGSGLRLWDNLMSAIDMADNRSGRNGVIAVVGGTDKGSTFTVEDVIALAQQSGVPLYLLGLKNETEAADLTNAAGASGGYYWSFEDLASLRERVEDAERLLRNYYLLHHESSDTLKNLSWRQLALDVTAYGYAADDTGIYQAPKGIHDIAVDKRFVSQTYRMENGDTLWTVQPGDSAYCQVRIYNDGDFPMYNIAVEDSLPDNVIPRSALFATFTSNPNRLTWTIDSLLVGEQSVYTYTCFVDTLVPLIEMDLDSRIHLSLTGDEMTSNDTDRDTIRYVPLLAADVEIQKYAVGDSSVIVNGDTAWYVYPQGTVTYQIAIQNHGEMPAKSIEVKDRLPQYLDWLYMTRPLSGTDQDTLIWQIPRLNGHEARLTWSYTCQVDSLMPPWDVSLVNMATIYSADDATSDNNTARDSVTAVGVAPPWPSIEVSPVLIYPEDPVEVYVTSPFTVSFWDLEVIYGDGSVNDTYADAFIAATTMNPNEMIQIDPDFTDTAQRTEQLEETVRIILKTEDIWGVARNDTASCVITLPDVVIDKRVESDSLRVVDGDSLWYADPGETVVYTVTLTNQGKLPCYQLEISDILAPDLSLLKFEGETTYTQRGDTLTWQLNKLDGYHDQVQYQYRCQVDSIMPPWIVNELNVASVSCDRDWDLSNNLCEVTLYAVGDIPPDPGVMVKPPQIEPGDSVQVYVVSPIEIEPGHWNLTIRFADGSVIDDYAQSFAMNHGLVPGDTLLIRPVFEDTRMRNDNPEEDMQVILETIDDWQASYFDTATVRLKSGDAFWLNDNVFRITQDRILGMRFRMSTNRHAKIVVYDIAGSFIKTVINGPYLAGWNQAVWNGEDRFHQTVGAGVYVAVYEAGDVKKAHKFIVVR